MSSCHGLLHAAGVSLLYARCVCFDGGLARSLLARFEEYVQHSRLLAGRLLAGQPDWMADCRTGRSPPQASCRISLCAKTGLFGH